MKMRSLCLIYLIFFFGSILPAQIVITGASPNPVCAGEDLTVTGTGLQNVNFATVGGLGASILPVSATAAIITIPAGLITGNWQFSITDGVTIASDSVSVDQLESAFFAYSEQTFCLNAPNPIPDSITTPGGMFTEITGGLALNGSTGEVDLANSISGGPYFITYTTSGNCPASYSTKVSISQAPSPKIVSSGSGSQVCEGEALTFSVTQVPTGSGFLDFEWYLNGSFVKTSPFPTFDPSLDIVPPYSVQDGDEIIVIARFTQQAGGCGAADTISVNVIPAPQVTLLDYPIVTSTSASLNISFMANSDNTYLQWELVSSNPVIPGNNSGQTSTFNNGDLFSISPLLNLYNGFHPESIQVIYTVFTSSCTGETDTLDIKISPTKMVFLPGLITPNGDGLNDTWLIQFLDDWDPSDFEIKVYSRNGGLVHAMSPVLDSWGAQLLPDGTYSYVLTNLETGEKQRKGTLIIRRK